MAFVNFAKSNPQKTSDMKRRFFVLSFVLLLALSTSFLASGRDGDGQNIVMRPQGGSHIDTGIVPADMPDVYYDSGEETLTIIGYGAVDYYEVEIVSGGAVALTDTVNGTSDTVDVSGLPAGSYTLTCTTPIGHVFSGLFTVP